MMRWYCCWHFSGVSWGDMWVYSVWPEHWEPQPRYCQGDQHHCTHINKITISSLIFMLYTGHTLDYTPSDAAPHMGLLVDQTQLTLFTSTQSFFCKKVLNWPVKHSCPRSLQSHPNWCRRNFLNTYQCKLQLDETAANFTFQTKSFFLEEWTQKNITVIFSSNRCDQLALPWPQYSKHGWCAFLYPDSLVSR